MDVPVSAGGILRVRVKLCGNCNPFTDAAKILNVLKKREGIKVLFSDEEACDVFLSMNGCDRACTASLAGSTGLVVSGWTFDGNLYSDETKLANAVAEKLLATLHVNDTCGGKKPQK